MVETAAPGTLCEFIVDYLKVMGLMEDPMDAIVMTPKWVKAQIHHLADSGPVFFNYDMHAPTKEELSNVTPDRKAYEWLFPRKTDKTEES